MHIGIIATWEMPILQPFAGGTESFINYFVEYLSKDHKVTIFAHPDSVFNTKVNFISYPNILLTQLLKLKKNPEKYQKEIRNIDIQYAMNELDNLGCDIIHNHCFSEIAIMYQDTITTPIVTTFHLSTYLTGYLQGLIGYGVNNGNSGNYVCVSADLSKSRNKYTNNITTILNGVKVSEWDRYSCSNSNIYYSCVGRICKSKGVSEAVEIAIKSGINLRIAGRITEESYFNKNIKPYLGEQIQYVGELNQKGINKLIGESAGFLFTPLCQEAFGLVLIEALASGTPVYAYNSGATPEIILPHVGVVVDQGDQEGLVHAIQTQTFDRAACRKHVEDHYTHERMMQEYIDLYEQILDSNK